MILGMGPLELVIVVAIVLVFLDLKIFQNSEVHWVKPLKAFARVLMIQAMTPIKKTKKQKALLNLKKQRMLSLRTAKSISLVCACHALCV